jgi:antitoxin (DNA-binding transcriptional repressor) of toxin-antitoxin stability system
MLALKTRWMYTVRMKKITATEARKDWFRLLDEVAAGEVAIIERNGRRLRLAREEESLGSPGVPDYSALIRAQAPDEADSWTWEWPGDPDSGDGLLPVQKEQR